MFGATPFCNRRSISGKIFFSALFLFFIQCAVPAQTPAFPGAEGYGRLAVGGRGGEVLLVTNLNDSGPGSLRAACEASGPRTVIFLVSGMIELHSSIKVNNPYLTIAGQTAPGDGICLKHSGASNFGNSLMQIRTHDVILRYLRFRRGPSAEADCCGDALSFSNDDEPVHDIIADHLSLSWSTDEIVSSWYEASDITVQNGLFAEPLFFSTHFEGEFQQHSMGPFFGDRSTHITLIRSVVAHSADRNPFALTRQEGFTARFQVINNLVYNWVYFGAKFGSDTGLTEVDFIGNHYIAGPDTRINRYEVMLPENGENHTKIYIEDNLGHNRTTTNNPNTEWDIAGVNLTVPASTTFRSMSRLTANVPVTILPVTKVYDTLLETAGAFRRLNADGSWTINRDAVDDRIILDIQTGGPETSRTLGNGKPYYGLIDSPDQVGGWPVYASSNPYPDEDKDGMSDTWEAMVGLNFNDPSDRNNDPDGDGYTNLEEFLNGTAPFPEKVTPLNIDALSPLFFPNPVKNLLTLNNPTQWKVLTIQGIVRKSGKGKFISMEQMPTGLYLIEIEGRMHRIIKVD